MNDPERAKLIEDLRPTFLPNYTIAELRRRIQAVLSLLDERGRRIEEAVKLLQTALTVGLNEGSPGAGFTPSKSESRAADLTLEIHHWLNELRRRT